MLEKPIYTPKLPLLGLQMTIRLKHLLNSSQKKSDNL